MGYQGVMNTPTIIEGRSDAAIADWIAARLSEAMEAQEGLSLIHI